MGNQDVEERVRVLLEPLAAEKGTAIDCVSLNETAVPPVLDVTVDRLSGTESLPLDDVADLAMAFSVALDAADPLEGVYQLEVGTPGAESELLRLRHYERNLGRKLLIILNDGEKVEGQLLKAGADGFTLAVNDGQRNFVYETVKQARATVQFGKGGR